MIVELRELKPSDSQALASIANNKKIADNLTDSFPFPYTLWDAERFIDLCKRRKDEEITRTIVVDQQLAGMISVLPKTDVHRKTAELGYWLAQEHWNKGITSQAVRLICKQAFETYDIVRIYAKVFAFNEASCRVLEKSGFVFEALLKNDVIKNDQIIDLRLYALVLPQRIKATKK